MGAGGGGFPVPAPSTPARKIEPHFFDLDWLIENFRPDRVEGRSPVAAAVPGRPVRPERPRR